MRPILSNKESFRSFLSCFSVDAWLIFLDALGIDGIAAHIEYSLNNYYGSVSLALFLEPLPENEVSSWLARFAQLKNRPTLTWGGFLSFLAHAQQSDWPTLFTFLTEDNKTRIDGDNFINCLHALKQERKYPFILFLGKPKLSRGYLPDFIAVLRALSGNEPESSTRDTGSHEFIGGNLFILYNDWLKETIRDWDDLITILKEVPYGQEPPLTFFIDERVRAENPTEDHILSLLKKERSASYREDIIYLLGTTNILKNMSLSGTLSLLPVFPKDMALTFAISALSWFEDVIQDQNAFITLLLTFFEPNDWSALMTAFSNKQIKGLLYDNETLEKFLQKFPAPTQADAFKQALGPDRIAQIDARTRYTKFRLPDGDIPTAKAVLNNYTHGSHRVKSIFSGIPVEMVAVKKALPLQYDNISTLIIAIHDGLITEGMAQGIRSLDHNGSLYRRLVFIADLENKTLDSMTPEPVRNLHLGAIEHSQALVPH